MLKYIVGLLAFGYLRKRTNLFLLKRKLNNIKNDKKHKIIEGADTFFLEGNNKTGILLIHGFTSTTDEFKELGKYLNKKNHTVFCPLLSGHGTVKEHLYLVNPKQWISEVDAGIKKLEHTCDKIYLIGCSFGGNLAILCANNNDKVKGIVTLGTPFIFRFDPLGRILVSLLKPFKLFRKKRQSKRILEVYKKNKRISYKELPLGPLAKVFKLIDASKRALPQMKKNILFIQANNDHIFNEKNLKFAFNNTGSESKHICLINDSIHVFIMDDKRWEVYKEIDNFINCKRPLRNSI